MSKRVMLDIETLGTDPGAVVLSIGAVLFDADGVDLTEQFYREIDMESAQDAGLHIDAGTLKWWRKQDESVREVLDGGEPLEQVLIDFADWLPNEPEVWANPPKFDCAMLETAFDAVNRECPWYHGDLRDYRTIRSLDVCVEVPKSGEKHHALDDARNQARSMAKTLDEM